MMKIGCVSLDTSHPKSMATKMEAACMDMRFEYLWDKGFRLDSEKAWFVNRFGLKGQVDEVKDMVGKVDIGFILTCNWEKRLELAMPFIEAGKPVFLDKPIVGSMKDIARVRQLIADGATIYGSSSCRYCPEVQAFKKESVETRGEVLSIFCTVGTDEFNYAVHVLEIMSEIAGAKAVSSQFAGYGKEVNGMRVEMYNVQFENGIRGTYHLTTGKHQHFHLTVTTTKGIRYYHLDPSQFLISLLRELYRQWRYGKSNLTDIENILNCSEVMLCGKKSRDERNGAEVTLSELTEDDKFDGYAFEEAYGAAAGVSYK